VLTTGAFLYAMLQSMVVPALTTIEHDLHSSQTATTWVFTSVLLSSAVATPILGRLGDMFGRSHMLLVSLSAIAVGTVVSALATSIGVLIIGRVIQGVGGGVTSLTFGIVRDVSPPQRVAGDIGFVAAMLAVGAGTGIVLSGPIAANLGFRWLFWIPFLAVIPIMIAAIFVIPRSERGPKERIDWLGALLLSGWLLSFLIAVSEAPTWGWGSAGVLGLFVSAIALLVLWVRIESRSTSPLVDMRLLSHRTLWRVNLLAFSIGMAMQGSFAFMPRFVQIAKSTGFGLGMSPERAGLVILPWSAGSTITGFLSGRLAARHGSKQSCVFGASLSIATFLVLVSRHGSLPLVFVAMGFFGIGTGLVAAAMPAILVLTVPAHQTGVSTGMNQNIRTIGGAVGAQIIATVLVSGAGRTQPLESRYELSFFLLGAMCIVATIAAIAVPSQPKQAPRGAASPRGANASQ
jgi:MFS family permease